VGTQGLPRAIALTTADVTDRAGALVAFSNHRDSLSAVTNVLVDGGYNGWSGPEHPGIARADGMGIDGIGLGAGLRRLVEAFGDLGVDHP